MAIKNENASWVKNFKLKTNFDDYDEMQSDFGLKINGLQQAIVWNKSRVTT